MKIICEVKLAKGSTSDKLIEIGKAIVKHTLNFSDEISGYVFCTATDEIEGMILIEPEEECSSINTKYSYNNGRNLHFKLSRRKLEDKDYNTWNNYIRMRDSVILESSKRKGPKSLIRPLPSRFTPSILIDNGLNSFDIALEVGFYLVHKKIIPIGEILLLLDGYIKKYFSKTYKDVGATIDLLDITPKIIDYWVMSKHPLSLKYHIGIYLQNIIRKEWIASLPEEKLFRILNSKKLMKHLYYLRARGRINIRKKDGNYKFYPGLLDKAKKNIETRAVKRGLAQICCTLKGKSYKNKKAYKTTQRWVQRQIEAGLSLHQIGKKLIKDGK